MFKEYMVLTVLHCQAIVFLSFITLFSFDKFLDNIHAFYMYHLC